MKYPKRVTIDELRRELASPDVDVRGRALQLLSMSLERQPELRGPAREIFHHAAEHETHNWLVTTSVRGIERLEGPVASRPLWRRLLSQPDPTAAGMVAFSVSDPSHLPMMLELFHARPEFVFRRGAVDAFGRMRDPTVIPLLLKLGEAEEWQARVVQALSTIGDSSAISWLQRLVPSNRPLPELDERGATWTLGDIAAQAIHRIEHTSRQPPPTGRPPPLPPLPPRPPGPPVSGARSSSGAAPGRTSTPGGAPVARGWTAGRLLSLLHPSLIPLVAAGLELAWLVFLFAFYLFLVGDQPPTFTVSPGVLKALTLPLPIIGFIAAAIVLAGKRTPRTWHKIVAVLGGLMCGAFVMGLSR